MGIEEVKPLFASPDAPQVQYINRYDEDGNRWYYHLDVSDTGVSVIWYRSVTSVLDAVMPQSPELFKWAVEEFGSWAAYREYMTAAASYGTLLHLAFKYLLTVPIEFTQASINALTRQLCTEANIPYSATYPARIMMDCYCLWRWIKDYKVRPILIEFPVFSAERGTAGCCDNLVWLTQPSGAKEELFIIDLKSGARDGNFYPSHLHQLTEYREIIRSGCLGDDMRNAAIGIANLSPKNIKANSRAFYNFKIWDDDELTTQRHSIYRSLWHTLDPVPTAKVKTVTGNSFEELSYTTLTPTELVISEYKRKLAESVARDLLSIDESVIETDSGTSSEPDHIKDALTELEDLLDVFSAEVSAPVLGTNPTPENSTAPAPTHTSAPIPTPAPIHTHTPMPSPTPVQEENEAPAVVTDVAQDAKQRVTQKRSSRAKKNDTPATTEPTAGNAEVITAYKEIASTAPGTSIVLLKDGALYKAYASCAILFAEATGTALSQVDIIGTDETIEAICIHEAAFEYCKKKCEDAGYTVFLAVSEEEEQPAPVLQSVDDVGLPVDGAIFYIYRISQPVFKAKRGGERMFIVGSDDVETGAFYDVTEIQDGLWCFAWTLEEAEAGKQKLIDTKLPF